MPLGSEDDFSEDDLATLAEFGIGVDPQAGEGDAVDPPKSEQTSTDEDQTTDQTAAKPEEQTEQHADDAAAAAAGTTTTEETQPAAADEPRGDVKQALRASRRAERRAKDEADRAKAEADRLRKELDEIKAQQPGPSDGIDLEELEAEFPAAAEALRKERQAREAAEARARQQAAAPAPAQADPDFEPPVLPPDIQDAVDDVPELLAWQNDPDQSRFELAVAADGLLQSHPQWRDKPMAERFAEVVRRVNAELSPAPAPAPTPAAPAAPAAQPSKAQQAIAAAPRATPETLSDLGGGQPTTTANNVERYAKMSDDDIFADLARGG